MWGGFCFPVCTYLSQWPCGFQGWGRPEDCCTALAMVIRGPSCWKLASLSGDGFSVLITGSVLETEQSIQTSCWMAIFRVLIIQLVFYFLFISGVFLCFGRLPGFWDLSSLTSDRNCTLAVKAPSPNYWNTGEFPKFYYFCGF